MEVGANKIKKKPGRNCVIWNEGNYHMSDARKKIQSHRPRLRIKTIRHRGEVLP